MDYSVIVCQSIVRRYLCRNKILIPSSQYQSKEWRKSRDWYINGKKNECELYQRHIVNKIIKPFTCTKTNVRINTRTYELTECQPMKQMNLNGLKILMV